MSIMGESKMNRWNWYYKVRKDGSVQTNFPPCEGLYWVCDNAGWVFLAYFHKVEGWEILQKTKFIQISDMNLLIYKWKKVFFPNGVVRK
jgi:hypothetical protein